MSLWKEGFSAELYARLLLDQNQEDVFDVWVGNEDECRKLAGAFERQFRCTVFREHPGSLTVCCPEASLGQE